ncbi:unnamed protein product, partial [Medioppia subpectinata]
IGGVHRGVEHSLDISADLTELGRTPIAVICSGVKSILDIQKTLQFLETQGVCVAVFNGDQQSPQKVEFPAFFSRKSGSQVNYNLKTAEEAARLILHRNQLSLNSGIVIAVPIPLQQQSDGELITKSIDEAIIEANEKGIIGKEVTPYLLKRVNQLSGGRSLTSNIALIENNARIGAEIAFQYNMLLNVSKQRLINTSNDTIDSKRINKSNKSHYSFELSKTSISESMAKSGHQEEGPKEERNDNQSDESSPVVIGGSIYDIVADANTDSLRPKLKIHLNTNILRRRNSNESIIKMSDEIRSAIHDNRPIVALESTIITHGMPFPINLQMALNVETLVRKRGVIPATIAVIDGKICVGLNKQQMLLLSEDAI